MSHPKASQLTPVPAAPCPHPQGQKSAPDSTSNPPALIPPPFPIPSMESGRRQLPEWLWNREFPVTTWGTTATSLLDTKNKQVCYAFFFFSPPKGLFF